jgi:D-aminopeptidase
METPVFLTSTMQLGRVYDAACELALERDPRVADDVVIPVVAECDDSYLNDCRRMQVTRDDVAASWQQALASRGAAAAPDEGAVGAGTGMSCLGFKGGIGTASRQLPSGHTVAVLLLTNFGERARLTIAGVPVGRLLEPGAAADDGSGARPPAGSCIGVAVTDAPVDGAACSRLARRIGLGLARAGSTASHGSGEIFLAAATGRRLDRDGLPDAGAPPPLAGRALDPVFAGVVEAAEEAVLNSLLTAQTVVGRDGNTSEGLDAATVASLLRARGAIP